MCTVSFIPLQSGFVFSSNRDEKPNRPTEAPQWSLVDKIALLYPKDLEKNGTWFAVSEQNRCVCLLNGAFHGHKKEHTYTKSRGLFPLLALSNSLSHFVNNLSLEGVEPFTLIHIDYHNLNQIELLELVWDGKEKYLRHLDSRLMHLWSSSTLYDEEVKEKRIVHFTNLFADFGKHNPDNIWDFHNSKPFNNPTSDFILERPDGIQTVSITQFVCRAENQVLKYLDYQKQTEKITNLMEKVLN